MDNATLTIMFQNMALLPEFPVDFGPIKLYKGTERAAAIGALIDFLLIMQPDIVGLCECFVMTDRNEIRDKLSDVYPYELDGPTEAGKVLNGGLLFLSKHAIVAWNQTIFRQAIGEDAFTSKGALHLRVEVPEHSMQYDLFLAHLQSENPVLTEPNIGLGVTAREKIDLQLLHLATFVNAYSSPDRISILMGDLNIDGLKSERYAELTTRLSDLAIPVTVPRLITFDNFGSFKAEDPRRAIDDPVRYQTGEWLDYFFVGYDIFVPTYTSFDVVVLQSSVGRDMSDHYGLVLKQSSFQEDEFILSEVINTVSVSLIEFRCLTETRGSVPIASSELGSDEIEFELRCSNASDETLTRLSPQVRNIDSGTAMTFDEPIVLIIHSPGEWIDIEVAIWEFDEVPLIGKIRTSIGETRIHIDQRQLLNVKSRSTTRLLPLIKGQGGEYAVRVRIDVK